MLYRPEPGPPNTTSPVCISAIGTRPPSGVNESCIASTAPSPLLVDTVAYSADDTIPKRVSFPSMLPPGWLADATVSMPGALSAGPAACSARITIAAAATNSVSIAA